MLNNLNLSSRSLPDLIQQQRRIKSSDLDKYQKSIPMEKITQLIPF